MIAYVKDLKYYGRTTYIDTKNNFIRDIIVQKEVVLKFLPTCEIVVDPFTKSIPRYMFFKHIKSIGLHRLWSMLIVCHRSLLIGYKILYTWSNEMSICY